MKSLLNCFFSHSNSEDTTVLSLQMPKYAFSMTVSSPGGTGGITKTTATKGLSGGALCGSQRCTAWGGKVVSHWVLTWRNATIVSFGPGITQRENVPLSLWKYENIYIYIQKIFWLFSYPFLSTSIPLLHDSEGVHWSMSNIYTSATSLLPLVHESLEKFLATFMMKAFRATNFKVQENKQHEGQKKIENMHIDI